VADAGKRLRIAMLLTDGFGGQGGIAKFNRDFLGALAAGGGVDVEALPRAIATPIEPLPAGVNYDGQAARGRLVYLWRVLRLVMARRRFDVVICGHIHLLPPAWLLARMSGARLALVVHGYEAWRPPRRILTRLLARRIDGLIAVSRLSAARFSGWSGTRPDMSFVLANAVDLDRFRPAPRDERLAARYGLGEGPVIMTLGRMAAHERLAGVDKGFDRLIDLMPRLVARVPGLTCMIAGDGDDRPRLEAKAVALGLGRRVIFTGAVAEADKPALYNLADVFVLPSTGEGFGIVLIEAAACGLAVVGSSRDGSREALLDGALGTLVDPDEPAALEGAVIAALASASGERKRRAGLEGFAPARFQRRVGEWLETFLSGSRHEPA
jgi:glycosyltransferase involved in cell wall biosynthesis